MDPLVLLIVKGAFAVFVLWELDRIRFNTKSK